MIISKDRGGDGLQEEEQDPHVDCHVPVQANNTKLPALKPRTKVLKGTVNFSFLNIPTYIQVEVRDVGHVWENHGQGQDPDQGQHHMHGEPLPLCLVSVNTEG